MRQECFGGSGGSETDFRGKDWEMMDKDQNLVRCPYDATSSLLHLKWCVNSCKPEQNALTDMTCQSSAMLAKYGEQQKQRNMFYGKLNTIVAIIIGSHVELGRQQVQ